MIVATGYERWTRGRLERYGYGVQPNVLTALEFERLTNASGPTGGRIVTKSLRHNKRKKIDEWVFDPEGESPRSVAIIHCVGSRDSNYNAYCSRVCCMYSLKFAHLVREKLPDAACYEFYIDMRAFGKGYEAFFERIREEGTFIVRGRTASVTRPRRPDGRQGRGHPQRQRRGVPGRHGPARRRACAGGPVGRAGAHARRAARRYGWFTEADYNGDPTGTERGGVYVAGVCQGPKDIPDTVAQASAVAARALEGAMTGRGLQSLASLSLSDIEARAKSLVPAP